MTKNCAYCEEVKPMTSEHIWPKFILNQTDYNIRYSERSGKVFSGELTVRDVCQECNNLHLGKLDAYASKLYGTYFSKFLKHNQRVVFKYDFGKLVRWLLKVAYNSARTTGHHVELLKAYVPALISEFDCSPINVGVFLTTIEPVEQRKNGVLERIPPLGMRCARIQIPGYDESWCVLRLIQMNSYMFVLILMKEATIDPEQAFHEVFHKIPGEVLKPSGRTVVRKPRFNTVQAMSGIENWPVEEWRAKQRHKRPPSN